MRYKYYIDRDNDAWRVSEEDCIYELFDDNIGEWYQESDIVYTRYIVNEELKSLTKDELFLEML